MATLQQLTRLTYFPLGFLLGWFFYETIIVRLKLHDEVNVFLLWIAAISCAMMFAFVPALRCVCLVAVPTLTGKNGRRILATWLIATTISGPIANMQENIREASMSFVCFQQLAQNRTTQMNNLINGPAIQILKNLQGNKDKIQKMGNVLGNGEDDGGNMTALEKSQQIGKEYRSLLDKMAQEKLTDFPGGMPDNLNVSCARQVAAMDCTPDTICASSTNGSKECHQEEKRVAAHCNETRQEMVDNCTKEQRYGDHGKRIKEFEDASQDLDNSFKGNVSFDVEADFNVNFNASVPLKKEIRQLARRRRAFLEAFKTIYSYIITFLLINALLSAYRYRSRYLSKMKWDNIYITRYFEEIDQRRHKSNKITVIPLKDIDRRPDLIRPNRLKQGPAEKKRMRSNFMVWVFVLVVLVHILYLDHLMSFAIGSFSRHGNITYRDVGSHNVSIEVIGTGPFARSIRNAYVTFVTPVDYFFMCLIMFLWFLLNFTDAYLLRLQRSICAYFYPQRERERNLYLYNEVLKDRKKGLKYMLNRYNKDKAKQRIDPHKLVGVCQLCQEPPPADDTYQCQRCHLKGMETLYCWQCWNHAIRSHCLECGNWRKAASMYSQVTQDKASMFMRPTSRKAASVAPNQ